MAKFLNKLTVPQIIVIAYILLISIGTFLLALPISTTSRLGTPFIDAFFMATSAVSVTGVTILDTATHWTFFGKLVLLFLIEIGGLGFLTIWVLLYYAILGRPNLKQRLAVSESLNLVPGENISRRIWYIIRFALIVQIIGAILLYFPFRVELNFFDSIFYALFHSVSAFTNGGLDLFEAGFIQFQSHPYVLIVIMLLIMTGGLGFIVWDDLLNYRKTKSLHIYTKVVLITTGILWVGGMLLYWIAEHDNGTFGHLPPSQQFVNYLMLSVTARSSGFANVDYSILNPGSLLLTNFLIFIGASSGSTGGGIKVSTLAIIVLVIFRSFQGKKATVFHRRIAQDTVQRAFFIFTSAIFFIIIGSFALSLTETLPEGLGIEYIVTEVVAALGVVGISLGLTPHLTFLGKIIIIILMLIGRVGVMTFLWSIVGEKRETGINHPEVNLLIG